MEISCGLKQVSHQKQFTFQQNYFRLKQKKREYIVYMPGIRLDTKDKAVIEIESYSLGAAILEVINR